jgi:hypothetical protein
MNVATAARIGAYLFAVLLATAPALATTGTFRAPTVDWREPLQRAERALANDERAAAQQAWEQAYRAAVQGRSAEGLLAVGEAYLRIGEAARDRATAVAWARRAFLTALFQAREQRDAPGVAGVATAFISLGDHEVGNRGLEIATAIATERGDVEARERIVQLRR